MNAHIGQRRQQQTPEQRGGEVVSLEHHIDEQFAGLWTFINERFRAEDEAKALARQVQEAHFERLNGSHEWLSREVLRFASKEELGRVEEKFEAQLEPLKMFQAELKGKASQQTSAVTLGLALVSLIIGLSGMLISLVKVWK